MMTKSMMIAAALLFTTATPALAATTIHTFTTTGSMADDGTYGNALSFSASDDATLKMRVTGWQANQATNDITKAYVGAYDGGLGVTGIADLSGDLGYHQIDNVLGFTDFLLLQFNRAVSLSSAKLNVYQMGGIKGTDSDMAFWNAGGVPSAAWNSAIDLTAYDAVPSIWTEVAGSSGSETRALASGAASTRWLVGASFLPTGDHDDGFKLARLSVSEVTGAVPEPGTWATMILGFGVVGAALRRKARVARGRLAALAA